MAVGDAFENTGPDVGVNFDVFVCVFWFELYDLADAEGRHFAGLEVGSSGCLEILGVG